jgi:hypothetical protein
MTETTIPRPANTSTTRGDTAARAVSAAGAALTVVAVALCSVSGSTGEDVVDSLAERGATLEVGAGAAAFAAAALLVSAARLGRLGGTAGTVLRLSGSLVAGFTALYYAVFGGAAAAAEVSLSAPGAGLGEATLLLLNVTDFARYGPGLALVAAALCCRRVLPTWLVAVAGLLALAGAVPWTAWAAALVIPVWLGVAGAVVAADAPRR